MPDADPPEDSAPWWWQVLSGSSEVPVLARGPAESMAQARFMTETAMHMLKGAVLGMAGGPGGQVDSCRRTTDGHWRWMPWPPEPEHEHAPIPGTIYSV